MPAYKIADAHFNQFRLELEFCSRNHKIFDKILSTRNCRRNCLQSQAVELVQIISELIAVIMIPESCYARYRYLY